MVKEPQIDMSVGELAQHLIHVQDLAKASGDKKMVDHIENTLAFLHDQYIEGISEEKLERKFGPLELRLKRTGNWCAQYKKGLQQ